MPLLCQRATCGHEVHRTRNGQWPRFCNCEGCDCRAVVKRERRADQRARVKLSVTVGGKLVIIRTLDQAVAIVQKLAKELDRERDQRTAAETK